MEDFKDVFPELNRMEISNLLRELRIENKIKFIGYGRKGKWILK